MITVPFNNLIPMPNAMNQLSSAYYSVMSTGKYILGRQVERFEHEWATYSGAKYCVGVGNGFDALQLSLRAFGVGERSKDQVLVPSTAPLPTWMAVSAVGAKPVPVDDGDWESKICGDVRAMIAVHLYGHIDSRILYLRDFADKYDIVLIEDCAQAHGAQFETQGAWIKAGTIGHAAAWSFYPTKNLGAYGDGGAITTYDEELYAKLRHMRVYGDGEYMGINSRLDPIQAAFIRVNLRYLTMNNRARATCAAYYLDNIKLDEWLLPFAPEWSRPVWHQFVIQHDRRDALRKHLQDNGIATMIHYPVPCHLLPVYYGRYDPQPNAEKWADTVLSLPIVPRINDLQRQHVVETINAFA